MLMLEIFIRYVALRFAQTDVGIFTVLLPKALKAGHTLDVTKQSVVEPI